MNRALALNLEYAPAFPYPFGQVDKKGEFENFLSINSERRLAYSFGYDDLPDELNLFGAEIYANWLGSLTQADPQNRERGTFVHSRLGAPELIYPFDPQIGDIGKFRHKVLDRDIEYPMTNLRVIYGLHKYGTIHSHPNEGTFSPKDFEIAISEKYSFPAIEPLFHIVSTPSANYMLLRTEDSQLKSPQESSVYFKEIKDTIHKEAYEYGQQLENASMHVESQKPGLGEQFYSKMLELVNSACLGRPFHEYYLTHQSTFTTAERFKFGFYKSDKSGNYKRVTSADLDTITAHFNSEIASVYNKYGIDADQATN